MGKAILIHGCRSEGDFAMKKKIDDALDGHLLSHLWPAYSKRENIKPEHVQDVIEVSSLLPSPLSPPPSPSILTLNTLPPSLPPSLLPSFPPPTSLSLSLPLLALTILQRNGAFLWEMLNSEVEEGRGGGGGRRRRRRRRRGRRRGRRRRRRRRSRRGRKRRRRRRRYRVHLWGHQGGHRRPRRIHEACKGPWPHGSLPRKRMQEGEEKRERERGRRRN